MLIELTILASCNVAGAALGGCDVDCPTQSGASYTICSVEEISIEEPGNPTPQPLPQRLCTYYVNGSIGVPTLATITAWVDVGSRLCIGDPVPEPVTQKPRTIVAEVSDAFTAYATRPFAYLSPAGEVEIDEPVSFSLNTGGGTHAGELLGRDAEIRFWPTGVIWEFSDGQLISGRNVSTSFSDPQLIRASARVSYRIDYRYPGADWVLGAASASLDTNELSLSVIDPPRRTLLRD